jgi:hypothetical protein
MQQPGPDAPRYVHVSDDYEAVLAAWTRLGFEPVPGWSRGLRSTLFRAGPSLVELVDAEALRAEAVAPAYAAAPATSGR